MNTIVAESYNSLRYIKPSILLKSKRLNYTLLKNLLITAFLAYSSYDGYQSMKKYGLLSEKSPLDGLYRVTTYTRNGDTIAPILTDTTRIRYLAFERTSFVTLFNMKKQKQFYKIDIDSLKSTFELVSYRDSTDHYKFNYKYTDSSMVLNGFYRKDSLQIIAKRYTKEDFPINRRPFKWIQEFPYNR